jgi:pyruvate/2-oxoglutarate dehydrogenase complex dihydrolipoamide dehydrogenase (E3) component
MDTENYTNVIIGSGEGGKYLAWHLASSGEKTIVVERRWIGGSCPNTNCLPSKNEIWSAKVAHLVSNAASFGVTTGPVFIDMAAVRNRKREMVNDLVEMHLQKYKASGAELLMGSAKLLNASTVEVSLNEGGTRTIAAERIFLNLGTRGFVPSIPGLLESSPMTNIEILELDRLPAHLVVIGGGYVGLEFAQAYRRFGSKVTILQHGTHLLDNQDPDVSEDVRGFLTAEGIEVITSADIAKVSGKSGVEVSITLKDERTISATDILVAAGRTPNTGGVGLEAAGVELDSHGYIRVNHKLETTASNIRAIGECAGSPQFTHASLDDFRIIRDNLAGGSRSSKGRVMPSCLFTDPPVAHIGLTETEAQQRSVTFQLAKIPMTTVLRTRTLSETHGFMKALISPSDGRILGFTMIGPEAGEVMAVVQMTM